MGMVWQHFIRVMPSWLVQLVLKHSRKSPCKLKFPTVCSLGNALSLTASFLLMECEFIEVQVRSLPGAHWDFMIMLIPEDIKSISSVCWCLTYLHLVIHLSKTKQRLWKHASSLTDEFRWEHVYQSMNVVAARGQTFILAVCKGSRNEQLAQSKHSEESHYPSSAPVG